MAFKTHKQRKFVMSKLNKLPLSYRAEIWMHRHPIANKELIALNLVPASFMLATNLAPRFMPSPMLFPILAGAGIGVAGIGLLESYVKNKNRDKYISHLRGKGFTKNKAERLYDIHLAHSIKAKGHIGL